jgi:hypothetical protein
LVVEQDYLDSCADRIILAEAGEPNWLTSPGMAKLAEASKEQIYQACPVSNIVSK